MIPYLKRLFAYDDWANRESLRALQRAEELPRRAREVMGHIVGCQWLWAGRLNSAEQPAEVWPNLSLEECGQQLEGLATMWTAYLRTLTTASLSERIPYVNSKGERWQNEVRDILFHILTHSSYHRGQLAILLGRAGQVPAYTDYVHCIRQQMIDTDRRE